MLDQFEENGQFTEPLNNNGTLSFNKSVYEDKVSFLDYVMGGCEIGVIVAVDFTLSNKIRTSPASLHYYNPPQVTTNFYTDALHHVMTILENYDTDNLYPAFGFGAKLPNGRNANDQSAAAHYFALNGNVFEPECSGVDGILNAYYNSITKCQLWGNTQFHHVLQKVNGFVSSHL